MFRLLIDKKEEFRNFGTGEVIPLEEVPDEAFSSKALGDGYAIKLLKGEIYAPVNGKISLVFPTGHAYGITTKTGIEVLLHLGIDTVELEGKGFSGKVKEGQMIRQGDLLTIMDLELIKKSGRSTICPLVFTSGQTIELLRSHDQVDHQSGKIFRFK